MVKKANPSGPINQDDMIDDLPKPWRFAGRSVSWVRSILREMGYTPGAVKDELVFDGVLIDHEVAGLRAVLVQEGADVIVHHHHHRRPATDADILAAQRHAQESDREE